MFFVNILITNINSMSLFNDINFWAVLLAAFTKVALGSFWYSPLILGHQWMAENKLTETDFIKGHPIWFMALMSFCFAFLAAVGISFFITPASTTLSGAGLGVLISVIWISTSKANTILYEKETLRHYLIHAGYDILGYIIMGAILGAWH